MRIMFTSLFFGCTAMLVLAGTPDLVSNAGDFSGASNGAEINETLRDIAITTVVPKLALPMALLSPSSTSTDAKDAAAAKAAQAPHQAQVAHDAKIVTELVEAREAMQREAARLEVEARERQEREKKEAADRAARERSLRAPTINMTSLRNRMMQSIRGLQNRSPAVKGEQDRSYERRDPVIKNIDVTKESLDKFGKIA